MEESGKAGKIPETIVGQDYAAPFLPPGFTIWESEVRAIWRLETRSGFGSRFQS
jgi:hypothetical protein